MKKMQIELAYVTDYIRNYFREKYKVETMGQWLDRDFGVPKEFVIKPLYGDSVHNVLVVYRDAQKVRVISRRDNVDIHSVSIDRKSSISKIMTVLSDVVDEYKTFEGNGNTDFYSLNDVIPKGIELPPDFVGDRDEILSEKEPKDVTMSLNEDLVEIEKDEEITLQESIKDNPKISSIEEVKQKKRGCNVYKLSEKVIGIRYSGSEAKNLVLFLAEYIYNAEKGQMDGVFDTRFGEEFILRQAENIYMFLYLLKKPETRLEINFSEITTLCRTLNLIGEKYNIQRYKDMAKSSMHNPYRAEVVSRFVDKLVASLTELGISTSLKQSQSSNSIYITVDDHRLRSIRVSDHESSANICLSVVLLADTFRCVTVEDEFGKDITNYYAPENKEYKVLRKLVEEVEHERAYKLHKLGLRAYDTYKKEA